MLDAKPLMDLGASLSHSLSHLTDLSNGCFTVFLGSDFLHLSQRKEQGILLRSLHGSAPPVLNVQRWRATMYDTLIMTDRCDRCDRGWSGWTHVWCFYDSTTFKADLSCITCANRSLRMCRMSWLTQLCTTPFHFDLVQKRRKPWKWEHKRA